MEFTRLCAELSCLAYQDRAAISDWTQARGLGSPLFFDDHGWAVRKVDKQIAVFRGTESVRDILEDLEIEQTVVNERLDYRAHTGFLECTMDLANRTDFRTWAEALPARPNLVLTGHSMGAAVATVVAYLLNRPGIQLVTFGSPRCCNAGLARWLEMRCSTERWVNRMDMVPRLPLVGYRHVGETRQTGQAFSDLEVLVLAADPQVWADHLPENYLVAA